MAHLVISMLAFLAIASLPIVSAGTAVVTGCTSEYECFMCPVGQYCQKYSTHDWRRSYGGTGYCKQKYRSGQTACETGADCPSGKCKLYDFGKGCDPAIDGGWSSWSNQESCSRTCGGGFQTRTRDCSNPPSQNCGLPCYPTDGYSEIVHCNTQACACTANSDCERVYDSFGNLRRASCVDGSCFSCSNDFDCAKSKSGSFCHGGICSGGIVSVDTDLIPPKPLVGCPNFNYDQDETFPDSTNKTCCCEENCCWDSCTLEHPTAYCLEAFGGYGILPRWIWNHETNYWVVQETYDPKRCSYSEQKACFDDINLAAFTECRDDQNRNAAHMAALADDAQCTKIILERAILLSQESEFDDTSKDDNGETPGTLAISEGNCNAARVQASYWHTILLGPYEDYRNLTAEQQKCVCCEKLKISSTAGAAAHQSDRLGDLINGLTYSFKRFDINGFPYYQYQHQQDHTLYNDPTSGRWMIGGVTTAMYDLIPLHVDMSHKDCTATCPNTCNEGGWSYYHNGRWHSDETINIQCEQ